MPDFSLNLKFEYQYRDAANYKQYNWIVFSNPNKLSIENIDALIRNCLFDREFFNHIDFGIPPLFFEIKNSDDHDWHEYLNISLTNEAITDERTIDDFLESIKIKSHSV